MGLFGKLFTLIAAFGLLFLVHQPAQAAWYEASSDHFVVYADDKEKDIARFAENLERFHSAMEALTGRRVEKPSPSNRVVIFVVGSERQLRKVAGKGSRNLAGFYVPRAGASRAFVQTIRNKNGYPDFSTIVLMHEYVHHFLISSSRYEMPRWLSEGAAEFFAAASFEKDGGVLIGRVARHRAAELAYAQDVSVRELLDHELYEENRGRRYDAFYGRSWLLYHYLTFNPDRRGQLVDYARAVFSGSSSIAAGEEVFGDLDALQKELDTYMRGRRFSMLTLPPQDLPIGKITIRRLPEGEAKMMPLRIRSQRGVTLEQAKELLPEVREVAAKYPDDPGVYAALAEAEFDAGNDDKAIAAANKAIALDPNRANPYVQKGYALFRKADNTDGDARDAAYEAAMEPFTALNQIENDHPMPLIYYYRSYVERGEEPPENAKHALERAAQLAPFDKSLWLNVAMMQLQEGKIELARQSLQPIAYDPHGGDFAEKTAALIKSLEDKPDGTPVNATLAGVQDAPSDVSPADDDSGQGAESLEPAGESEEGSAEEVANLEAAHQH
ncbi:DUF1570 domain-containing protein [Erythrobacter sp. YT30]|uniref:tetratricopeptide repeat protein n=1 Tax=Erythrobacter sp. YT30 TaxID=1735012 RepID=UPI0009EA393C|nr:DUF1570 domain-containing protein [Erythrobacter sp. YT30]